MPKFKKNMLHYASVKTMEMKSIYQRAKIKRKSSHFSTFRKDVINNVNNKISSFRLLMNPMIWEILLLHGKDTIRAQTCITHCSDFICYHDVSKSAWVHAEYLSSRQLLRSLLIWAQRVRINYPPPTENSTRSDNCTEYVSKISPWVPHWLTLWN